MTLSKSKKCKKTRKEKTVMRRDTYHAFFNGLIGELFLFLNDKKLNFQIHVKWSLSSKDLWFLDFNDLLFIFDKFKRFYHKNTKQHPILNFLVMAMVFIFYEHYFQLVCEVVCRAARRIFLSFRSKLHSCCKEDLEIFYLSHRDSIEEILETKCKFVNGISML